MTTVTAITMNLTEHTGNNSRTMLFARWQHPGVLGKVLSAWCHWWKLCQFHNTSNAAIKSKNITDSSSVQNPTFRHQISNGKQFVHKQKTTHSTYTGIPAGIQVSQQVHGRYMAIFCNC